MQGTIAPLSVAIVLLLIILVGSVFQQPLFVIPGQRGDDGHHGNRPNATPLSLSPRWSALHEAAMGVAVGGVDAAAAQDVTVPTYDEQMGSTFVQDFGALAYNVTALAQTDTDGYGPAYLLNGLTPAGYWYQVGISYHWPTTAGSYPSFGFSYQVFGPNDKPVYPATGGSGLENFSASVTSGDSVLLSLNFTGTSVQMLARDWNTGAVARTNFSSFGSSMFLGNRTDPSNYNGFFTGLMTEWFHVAPYSGSEGGVTYTNYKVNLTSAWMWLEEFKAGTNADTVIFNNRTQGPVMFANDKEVYPFSSNGASMYLSNHEFITGLLSGSSSKVTLVPFASDNSPLSFSANYTFSGRSRTSVIGSGANFLEADPGTPITISIQSSQSPFDRWVFSGSAGAEVTFPAGGNSTYAFYHLVEETVWYQVAIGGDQLPASLAPELHYEVPPSSASSSSAPVVVTQVLSTAPTVIFAVLGSNAGIYNGTIAGPAGERWVASAQNWTISGEGLIPGPIEFYQQYQISLSYSLAGGSGGSAAVVGAGAAAADAAPTPSQPPDFIAASSGGLAFVQLSSTGKTTAWFDAGSSYSFTNVINASTPNERWVSSGKNGSAPSTISSPNETLSEVYTPQYYVQLSVNDPSGGVVSNDSGWFGYGSRLTASASANQGWHFEGWNGSGTSPYTGTSPSLDLAVTGPVTEEATFYVQLQITADPGTDIAFSSPSGEGMVHAGTTETVYVQPSQVTLRASPSLFVYSFSSWQRPGSVNVPDRSLVLTVDSPNAVKGTSSYNYFAILATVMVLISVALFGLAGSVWYRGQQRRRKRGSLVTTTTTTAAAEVPLPTGGSI
jgi:hypothetical protein